MSIFGTLVLKEGGQVIAQIREYRFPCGVPRAGDLLSISLPPWDEDGAWVRHHFEVEKAHVAWTAEYRTPPTSKTSELPRVAIYLGYLGAETHAWRGLTVYEVTLDVREVRR